MRRLILSLVPTMALISGALAQPAADGNPAATIPPESGLPYTKERFAKNMEALATTPRPIHLVFDGDSITDLWQLTGKAVWDKNFATRRAFDFGISADRTQCILWRLDRGQVDGLDPKLIALMIGTNNIGADSPRQIAEGIETIVAEYQRRCPNSVILLQGVFPRGQSPDNPDRAIIKNINQRISVLGDGKKIIFVDFGDKFLEPDGTMSPEVMPDFLHPSAKGYEIWTEAIQPIVDNYCPAE